jgi:hypothetical protein
MTWHKDDWPKWRRGGAHLTEAELEFIRASKRAGRKIKDVACELRCSSRTVEKHYGAMGDQRRGQSRPKAPPAKRNLYVADWDVFEAFAKGRQCGCTDLTMQALILRLSKD